MRSSYFKAGMFVVVTVFFLLIAWMWLANIRLKKEMIERKTYFTDVTGLKVNDPVRVRGVDKGKVKEIKFDPQYIEVIFLIDPDIPIFTDAYTEIKDIALISGTKYISLYPGTSGILLPVDSIIPGKPSIGLPLAVITEIGEKITSLMEVFTQNEILHSLPVMIKNLEISTLKLREIMEKSSKNFQSISFHLKKNAETLAKITPKIDTTIDHIDSILVSLNKGEGTLGKLLKSDTLYSEVRNTLISIKNLAEDIKKHPKRYIKLF